MEPFRDVEPVEALDRCGQSTARVMFQGVIIELENRNLEGVLYEEILGRIRYNTSLGVLWIFEDGEGLWKFEVTGRELHGLHRDLVLGRRESIRLRPSNFTLHRGGDSAENKSRTGVKFHALSDAVTVIVIRGFVPQKQ